MLVGSMLGYERTKAKKPAGIRTHALVSLAATMISIVSAYGFYEFRNLAGYTMDPARLLVGIITGIGFLGAGIIWKDSNHGDVRGLTTAANIWASAGLGIATGLGHYFLVLSTVSFMLLALRVSTILIKIGILKHDEEDMRIFDSTRD
ncbi:MAG: MgtC/SapB family protein [Clostridia bacterium]|nr:MgtC/SapB family protein [Clostridia bacterium]